VHSERLRGVDRDVRPSSTASACQGGWRRPHRSKPRFASPTKLCRYTGLCLKVKQSGDSDRRGPICRQRPQVPALSAVRGRAACLRAAALSRPLPAHQAAPRPPARPQGRPDRPVAQDHRSDLAHAHPQPARCSGRRPFHLAARRLKGSALPEQSPMTSNLRHHGAIERSAPPAAYHPPTAPNRRPLTPSSASGLGPTGPPCG
jgi:hypothetical protein